MGKLIERERFPELHDSVATRIELWKTGKSYNVFVYDDPYSGSAYHAAHEAMDFDALTEVVCSWMRIQHGLGHVNRRGSITGFHFMHVEGVTSEESARALHAFLCAHVRLMYASVPNSRNALDAESDSARIFKASKTVFQRSKDRPAA